MVQYYRRIRLAELLGSSCICSISVNGNKGALKCKEGKMFAHAISTLELDIVVGYSTARTVTAYFRRWGPDTSILAPTQYMSRRRDDKDL